MSFLQLSGITKKEGERLTLDNIHFLQGEGQKIAIAGETGSGKTSLLKMIAGLAQPDAGEVLFQGKRVKGSLEKLIPGHPEIAYLSQYFELRNNYRVEEELDCRNKLSEEQAAKIYEVCRIGHLLKRKTSQLSGGERQRIVLAALLTTLPKLLLLDEPYSNLDPLHRGIIKSVIRDIGEVFGTSFILVSHEAADTLSWADQLLVLKEGRIIQQGTPQTVYHQPANEYVAALFGEYNLLEAGILPGLPAQEGKRLFLRPGQIGLSLTNEMQSPYFGTAGNSFFTGGYYQLNVIVNGSLLTLHTVQPAPQPGTLVFLSFQFSQPWFL